MKRAKYRNRKTNGYASAKEAKRAGELKLMQRAGLISDLREQVEFELIPTQSRDGKVIERACKYRSDFAYNEGNQLVIEDTKGMRTKDYIIKRKLMLQVHGIQIREV